MTDAIAQVAAWKTDTLLAFAVALARLLCEQHYAGVDEVGLELSDADRRSIPGNATKLLQEAHVIRPYFGHDPERGLLYGRRRSRRPGSKGAYIATWELSSRAVAEEFLRRHEATVPSGQLEMAI